MFFSQFFGFQILMKISKILANLVKFTLKYVQSPSDKTSLEKQADWNLLQKFGNLEFNPPTPSLAN